MQNGGYTMTNEPLFDQPLLTKQQLQILNRRGFNYNLSIAEKDYFLAVVSKIIYNSELSKKIVFKGGTAIHHCYLEQSRFSEDLDFSSHSQEISLDEVKQILEAESFLEVREPYVSKATIKIQRLKYSGVLDQPGSLKVEIDFIQNIILPPQEMTYKNVWGVDTKVRVMDIKEICAEKIRAMSDRARYRDFYDFYLIIERYKLDMEEIYTLLRKKEVRKIISTESILQNWQLAKEAKEQERQTVYYKDAIFEHDDMLEDKLKSLSFEPIAVSSIFTAQQ